MYPQISDRRLNCNSDMLHESCKVDQFVDYYSYELNFYKWNELNVFIDIDVKCT